MYIICGQPARGREGGSRRGCDGRQAATTERTEGETSVDDGGNKMYRFVGVYISKGTCGVTDENRKAKAGVGAIIREKEAGRPG